MKYFIKAIFLTLPFFTICKAQSIDAKKITNPENIIVSDQIMGQWVNTDPHTKGITKLIFPSSTTIHAYGKCNPTDCDWKVVLLSSGQGRGQYKAVFRFPFETHTLIVSLIKSLGNKALQLDVVDEEHHEAENGKPGWDKVLKYIFNKQ